jgi:hypothetical protein
MSDHKTSKGKAAPLDPDFLPQNYRQALGMDVLKGEKSGSASTASKKDK